MLHTVSLALKAVLDLSEWQIALLYGQTVVTKSRLFKKKIKKEKMWVLSREKPALWLWRGLKWDYIFLQLSRRFTYYSEDLCYSISFNVMKLHQPFPMVIIKRKVTRWSSRWSTNLVLALFVLQQKVPGSNPGSFLSVWSLHVLLLPVWVFLRHSGFLPQSKKMLYRLEISKLSLGVHVSECVS